MLGSACGMVSVGNLTIFSTSTFPLNPPLRKGDLGVHSLQYQIPFPFNIHTPNNLRHV